MYACIHYVCVCVCVHLRVCACSPGNFRFHDRIRLLGVSDLHSSISTSIPLLTDYGRGCTGQLNFELRNI